MKRKLLVNILLIWAVWAFVGLVCILTGSYTNTFSGIPLMYWNVLIIFAIQMLFFITSWMFKTELLFDLIGSLTFITIIVWSLYTTSNIDINKGVIGALIIVWALRLGTFLFLRRYGSGKDVRLKKFLQDPLSLMLLWNIQGLWIFFTSLAAIIVILSPQNQEFGLIQWTGLILWVIGFFIEVLSDNQKMDFKSKNMPGFISTGMWSISRHPNYLGEVLLWLGIFIISLTYLTQLSYIAILSPILVFIMLRFVSGIPQLEKRAEKSWGDKKEYKDYIKKTPIIFPKIF